MNSAFRAFWLVNSKVISKVLFSFICLHRTGVARPPNSHFSLETFVMLMAAELDIYTPPVHIHPPLRSCPERSFRTCIFFYVSSLSSPRCTLYSQVYCSWSSCSCSARFLRDLIVVQQNLIQIYFSFMEKDRMTISRIIGLRASAAYCIVWLWMKSAW